MAKATKVKVPVETYVDSVTLELSQKEAQVLVDLIGICVIGPPSGRRFSDAIAIYEALSEIGFEERGLLELLAGVEFKEPKRGF